MINVHTHHSSSQLGLTQVINRSLLSEWSEPVIPHLGYSVGLHPYDVGKISLKEFEELFIKELTHSYVLAIGECGLDKNIAVPFELQETFFKKQLDIAVAYSLPVILHCVRAHQEILKWTKSHISHLPIIMHGVNKKWTVMKDFVDKGYYLSFGPALLGDNPVLHETFIQTPLSQVFLETDDADCTIEKVYQKAAELKKNSFEELILQVQNNFNNVFKHK